MKLVLNGLKQSVLSDDVDQRLTAVVTLRRMLSRGALLGGAGGAGFQSTAHFSCAHPNRT